MCTSDESLSHYNPLEPSSWILLNSSVGVGSFLISYNSGTVWFSFLNFFCIVYTLLSIGKCNKINNCTKSTSVTLLV